VPSGFLGTLGPSGPIGPSGFSGFSGPSEFSGPSGPPHSRSVPASQLAKLVRSILLRRLAAMKRDIVSAVIQEVHF